MVLTIMNITRVLVTCSRSSRLLLRSFLSPQASFSSDHHVDYLFGYNVVLPALRANRRKIHRVLIQDSLQEHNMSSIRRRREDPHYRSLTSTITTLHDRGISIEYVAKSILDRFSLKRPHNGIVMETSTLDVERIRQLSQVDKKGHYHAVVDYCSGVSFSKTDTGQPLWLMLDALTDPQNIGAVLRSAYFFGVDGVALVEKGSPRLTNTVSKASAGALELMDIFYAIKAMTFVKESKRNGWRIIAAGKPPTGVSMPASSTESTTTQNSVNPIKSTEPSLLILGNERTGIRSSLYPFIDEWLWIPQRTPPIQWETDDDDDEVNDIKVELSDNQMDSMLDEEHIDSLNVSVAAGILLHELSKR